MPGVSRPGAPFGDHHTPTFLADGAAGAVGIRSMASLLLDALRRDPKQR